MSIILLLCNDCLNGGSCTKGNVEAKIDEKVKKGQKLKNSLIKMIDHNIEAALAGSDANTEKYMENFCV